MKAKTTMIFFAMVLAGLVSAAYADPAVPDFSELAGKWAGTTIVTRYNGQDIKLETRLEVSITPKGEAIGNYHRARYIVTESRSSRHDQNQMTFEEVNDPFTGKFGNKDGKKTLTIDRPKGKIEFILEGASLVMTQFQIGGSMGPKFNARLTK